MDRPPFEVADVIRALADADGVVSGLRLSTAQKRVLQAIAACRTAKLGGHVEECDAGCGHQLIAYNSCGNRHCPKCQARHRAEWLQARRADVLPVSYFHVVFTLASTLAPLALQNRRAIYGLLFSAAGETLKEIAADPKHLGAELGFIAVLHTWGQTLMHHPHLHCVVPGGGPSADGTRWISTNEDFLLPVRVLSKVFRGKFIAGLRALFDKGRLNLEGELESLADPASFDLFCGKRREQDWVVYAKSPFGGPEQVLKYLARYTRRVAIANRRIVEIQGDLVTFTYKDYSHNGRQRLMSLIRIEFLRRFVQHVLPDGFVRIRHFGFLANRCRKDKLALCRRLLSHDHQACNEKAPVQDQPDPARDDGACIADDNATVDDAVEQQRDPHSCPQCGKGRMRPIEGFGPQPTWEYHRPSRIRRDTS